MRCKHRKDGTSRDTFVMCGEVATDIVFFAVGNTAVPMCAEHTSATVGDKLLGACSEPLVVGQQQQISDAGQQ